MRRLRGAHEHRGIQPASRRASVDDGSPRQKNALDFESYSALTTGLQAADADENVHAIVITGANDAFSSGNDLSDFRRLGDPTAAGDPTPALGLLRALVLTETPLIAAVEGAAVGIGVTMLLHCDLAVAARSAKFRLPFVPLGLTPEGGSSHILPRIAGSKLAAELLLFGEAFNAEVAERAGLLNRVVPDGEALSTALILAVRLGELPPGALRAAHRILHRDRDQLLAVIDEELTVFMKHLASVEAQTILNSLGDWPSAR